MRKLLSILFLAMLIQACTTNQIPERVPAFKVTILHYVIEGKHVVKFQSIQKVNVSPSKIRMYVQPPFPGIHIFSIYSKGVSDVAYIPIDREGENLTVYFTYNPERSPENGEKVLMIVEVRDARGKTLANDVMKVKW